MRLGRSCPSIRSVVCCDSFPDFSLNDGPPTLICDYLSFLAASEDVPSTSERDFGPTVQGPPRFGCRTRRVRRAGKDRTVESIEASKGGFAVPLKVAMVVDRKSTRLNSSPPISRM